MSSYRPVALAASLLLILHFTFNPFSSFSQTDEAAVTDEDEGVRAIFKRPELNHHRVKFDSAIVRLDINTPEAYETALASYADLARVSG